MHTNADEEAVLRVVEENGSLTTSELVDVLTGEGQYSTLDVRRAMLNLIDSADLVLSADNHVSLPGETKTKRMIDKYPSVSVDDRGRRIQTCTGCGCKMYPPLTCCPKCHTIWRKVQEVQAVVRAEREACAALASAWPDDGKSIADAILARGQTNEQVFDELFEVVKKWDLSTCPDMDLVIDARGETNA